MSNLTNAVATAEHDGARMIEVRAAVLLGELREGCLKKADPKPRGA